MIKHSSCYPYLPLESNERVICSYLAAITISVVISIITKKQKLLGRHMIPKPNEAYTCIQTRKITLLSYKHFCKMKAFLYLLFIMDAEI